MLLLNIVHTLIGLLRQKHVELLLSRIVLLKQSHILVRQKNFCLDGHFIKIDVNIYNTHNQQSLNQKSKNN